MKTLENRESITTERTELEFINWQGKKENITFYIYEVYNCYTDGTRDLFETNYCKNDNRYSAPNAELCRFYNTELGYRNALKRWSKKMYHQLEIDNITI